MATDKQFVAALSHGLDVLRCFTPDEPLLTNSALARLTGLPRSSVSRLTHTLVKVGYLDYDTQASAYRLGLDVVSLQPAALAGARIAEDIFPHMADLAGRLRTRVLLAVYERYALTVVQRACTNPDIPAPSPIGFRYGIPRRAAGRAYLASCAVHEQEQIVAHLARGEEARSRELHGELDGARGSYRSRGYCTSLGETRPGNHSISVMLNLPHLGRRLALSCGGPADQLPERVLHDRVGPALLQAAASIEQASGRLVARKTRAFTKGSAA